jgi:dihydrolipoamide dehydrogenase
MKFDICIVGAGPAGYPGALIAAREGRKVALIEADRAGGTCLNWGCIPTKALRQCADALLLAREQGRFGVTAPAPGFDFGVAARFRDEVKTELVRGVEQLLQARKVTVIRGRGKLLGPGKVAVNAGAETTIEAGHVIVATGSRPSDLPGIALDERRILSSEGALALTRLPASVIVIGGGVIGCEFADIFAAMGAKVTVVEAMPRILLLEDKATARAAQKSLEARGVTFLLGTTVASLEAGEQVRCRLASGAELAAETMIVSVGRRPNVSDLGLEAAGVELERGAIKVDSHGRTSAHGVWAAGDVIGPPLLAHAATHEMEVVMANILGHEREFDRRVIPSVIFLRPEIASVGLLEDRAREERMEVRVGRCAYAANGKARCLGETEGWLKLVAGADGAVLGATVMGAHASDLIHEIALAMKAGLRARDLFEMIHAHPTLSEMVMEAAADTQGLAIHKIGRKGETR